MKKKYRPGCTRVVVETRVLTVRSAAPIMGPELDEDLHKYGFYEIFAAAEQLWAIEVGLAEKVEDWKP